MREFANTLSATPTREGDNGGAVTRPAAEHTGTATINCEDGLTVAVSRTGTGQAVEGSDETFRVTLTGGVSQNPIVIDWSAVVTDQQNTDATAMPGEDDDRPNDMANPDLAAAGATASADGATISGASITIPAGQPHAEFTITIRQDARKEGLTDTTAGNEHETVTLTIGNSDADGGITGRGVTAPDAGNELTFQIAENPASTRFLAVTVDDDSADEGQALVFTVTLTGAAHDSGAAAQTVDWTITGSVEGGDYSGAASGTLNFGTGFAGTSPSDNHVAGALTRTIRITITDDTLNEAAETLIFTLSNVQGGSCDSATAPEGVNCSPATAATMDTVTVTIAESDPITYAFAAPTSRAAEGASATYTVRLSAASEGDITVPFTIDSTVMGAATSADYTTPSPLTVTIPAGSAEATLSIATTDDALNEADETITVELSAATVSAFAKADEAGAVTRTTTAEMQTATATITDNDRIGVTVARTTPAGSDAVEEGAVVTFTVSLTGPDGSAITSTGGIDVPWSARMTSQSASAISDGTATPNDMTRADLTTTATTVTDTGVELTGTLSIAAGDSTGTVAITVANDALREAEERFAFSVSAPAFASGQSGGALGIGSPSSVAVDITANEAALHVVTIEVEPTVAEDDPTDGATASNRGQITYTFKLNTPPSGDPMARTAALTATYELSDTGTATGGGVDYTSPIWKITFPMGDDADITRTIDITADRIDEGAGETIILRLTGVTGGDNEDMFPGTAAASASRTVTIVDNDTAGIVFQSGGAAIPEGGLSVTGSTSGSLTYSVRLTSQPAAGDVILTPTITPGRDPVLLTLSDTGTPADNALTFTNSNWHTTQTVTVDAGDTRGMEAFSVNYAVTANTDAPAYAGIANSVAITVNGAVSILPPSAAPALVDMMNPLIQASGQSVEYPVSLGGTNRAGNVRLDFEIACVDTAIRDCGATPENAGAGTTSDGVNTRQHQGVAHVATVTPTSLTFTPEDGATQKTVTVTIPPQARGSFELRVTNIEAPSDPFYRAQNTAARRAELTVQIRAIAFNTAVDNVNRVILPEVARALAVGSQMQAIGNRLQFRAGDAAGAAFNLGGQSEFDSMLATGIRDEAGDNNIDWKKVLGDSSFHMPLAADDGGGGFGGGAFWGGGEYRSIGGKGNGVKWDGTITGARLGFDTRLGDSALAGLMVHYGDAEIEHEYDDPASGNRIKGDWLLEMTTINPYLGWQRGALEGWALVGFGDGELEVDETGAGRDERPLETDVSMTTFGLGMSGAVVRESGREVRVKAEASSTTTEVDEGETITGHREGKIPESEVDTNLVRVMLESSRTRQLDSGADFRTSAEVGLRYDGGDGRTGGGSELGVGFHYTGPGGVSVEARARGLIGHRADYDDWGISGSIRMQPGADGQGLSLALTPAYGQTADGTQGMWDNGLFNADAADGDSAEDLDLEARMQIEAAYGVKAFTDTGLLKPNAAMTFSEGDNREVKLGVGWQTNLSGTGGGIGGSGGATLILDLSTNRATTDTTTDDTVTLKGEVKF